MAFQWRLGTSTATVVSTWPSRTTTSNSIGVLFGQPGGTFSAATAYSSGGVDPTSLAIGDLNGDGRPDLVVANSGDTMGIAGNVAVLLGQPGGTFASPLVLTSGGICPTWVGIADFDGDGRPDVAVVNSGSHDVVGLTNASTHPFRSPHGLLFDVQPSGPMAGQLVEGTDNAFDGLNRLQVGGVDYAPAAQQLNLDDGGQTLVLPAETMAGLSVSAR